LLILTPCGWRKIQASGRKWRSSREALGNFRRAVREDAIDLRFDLPAGDYRPRPSKRQPVTHDIAHQGPIGHRFEQGGWPDAQKYRIVGIEHRKHGSERRKRGEPRGCRQTAPDRDERCGARGQRAVRLADVESTQQHGPVNAQAKRYLVAGGRVDPVDGLGFALPLAMGDFRGADRASTVEIHRTGR